MAIVQALDFLQVIRQCHPVVAIVTLTANAKIHGLTFFVYPLPQPPHPPAPLPVILIRETKPFPLEPFSFSLLPVCYEYDWVDLC